MVCPFESVLLFLLRTWAPETERCGEMFQAKAPVQMSYIVSVHCSLYLGSKDFSEVEGMGQRGIHFLMESQGHKKRRKNPIMGLLSRAEY